jgi:Protein of unknown function (DUF4236)
VGLRFRKSIKLFPGVRINLSKSGISASLGVPGATLNIGKLGLRSTVGIPGSGLSYTAYHSRSLPSATQASVPVPDGPGLQEIFLPSEPLQEKFPVAPNSAYSMQEINSAATEQLTSSSLVQFKNLISAAKQQRAELNDDLAQADSLRVQQEAELARRSRSVFRFFYRKKIERLEDSLPIVISEIERLQEWQQETYVDVTFDTSREASRAYGNLNRAFDKLSACEAKWDVTAGRNTNQPLERTAATRVVSRSGIVVSYSSSDLIRFDGRAMSIGNANGEDILIYPGFVLMPRADDIFAVIDVREIELTFKDVNFFEEDTVPSDASIFAHTWAKTNKDGSRDMRFKDNYQIPVCHYGQLRFTSRGGIEEEFQFSNPTSAREFCAAYNSYKSALAGYS